MPHNSRTPAVGAARVLENGFVGTAAAPGFTAQPALLQAHHISRRVTVSASVAAVIAEHCFTAAESWRARA